MATGKKTGGRRKGTPNKVTADVREVITAVASRLGGTERLLDWVKEDPLNERLFWSSIWVKVLPKEVHVDGKIGLEVLIADDQG